MAKHKKRRRRPGSKSNSESSAQSEKGLLPGTGLRQDHSHLMIALALSCLAAGLLILINLDRTIHKVEAARLGRGTSLHGWPTVYLERHFDSLPSFLTASERYDWPYPEVKNEIRTMNNTNLFINIACGIGITLLTYWAVRIIVFRYEKWKKSWKTD